MAVIRLVTQAEDASWAEVLTWDLSGNALRAGAGSVHRLSPHIRPGTVSTVPYNHYSLLRTIEDIFGLPHLGDAAMPQARPFGADGFG